jgi:hypothetical protein
MLYIALPDCWCDILVLHRTLVGKPERDHKEDVDVGGKIILK